MKKSNEAPGGHPLAWVKDWIKADAPEHLHKSLVAVADSYDWGSGYVWRKQADMAAEWGINPRSFRRHLRELEALGAIRRERRHRKAGDLAGTRTSDLIFLLPATGHLDGHLPDSLPATKVATTTGHLDGRAGFTSYITSRCRDDAPHRSTGADAPNSLSAADDEEAADLGLGDAREDWLDPDGRRRTLFVSPDGRRMFPSYVERKPGTWRRASDGRIMVMLPPEEEDDGVPF